MASPRARLFLLMTLALAALSPVARAADFYVDPASGDIGNDGSAGSPWSTLQEVIENDLIETHTWAQLPYDAGSQLVRENAGAPVKAGDTIWLRSGYHGEITIQRWYNADFITIAAQEGHSPEASSVLLQAVGKWILRGLSVSPTYAATYGCGELVTVGSHNYSGPAREVVIEDFEIFSVRDTAAWTIGDWNDLPCNGIGVSGDDVVVRNNRLLNVKFGISVSGQRALVEHNVVENFAGDGMRGLGDHGTFQYNTVKNCYDVNDNHDDGFQSWSTGEGGVGTGEVVGITLRGNTIINYEDPAQPFRGPLQGIGCFDGMFVDWVVENNVIMVDHWHGITLLGARDSRIVNNTVVDLNDVDPGPPWVRIGTHKNGTASSGCVVRNNLTTAVSVDADQDVTVDSNIIVGDYADHFVDYAGLDLHLIADSAAVNTGAAALAPAIDRDGIPRPQGDEVDVGAYEYFVDDPAWPDGGAVDVVRPDAAEADVAEPDAAEPDVGGADAGGTDGETTDGGVTPVDSGAQTGGGDGGEGEVVAEGCACAAPTGVDEACLLLVGALGLMAWRRQRR